MDNEPISTYANRYSELSTVRGFAFFFFFIVFSASIIMFTQQGSIPYAVDFGFGFAGASILAVGCIVWSFRAISGFLFTLSRGDVEALFKYLDFIRTTN